MEGTLSQARAVYRAALFVPLCLQLSGCAALRALLIPGPLVSGQRVRVSVPSSSQLFQTGRLVALTEDSLILGRDTASAFTGPGAVFGRLAVSLDSVEGFEVSRGIHRNVLNGGLIGAMLGSLGGLAILCTRIHDCLGHRTDLPASQAVTVMLVSAGTGAAIGGTVGYFVRGEHWEGVSVDQLGRQRVAPPPQSGMRLVIGVSLFPPFPGPRRAPASRDR